MTRKGHVRRLTYTYESVTKCYKALVGVVLSTDYYKLKIPAGKSFLFLIFSMRSLVETGIPFKLGKTQGKLEFPHSQRCLVNWRRLESHIRTLPGWLGWYKQKHDGKRKF